MDGSLSVIYGDGNCSRRATVRLGIDTLIANILVFAFLVSYFFAACVFVKLLDFQMEWHLATPG